MGIYNKISVLALTFSAGLILLNFLLDKLKQNRYCANGEKKENNVVR